MKKLVSKKLFFILVVALFTICFGGVAVAEETNMVTIKGVINNIILDTGQIEVLEESGEILTLTAAPDIDINAFTAGDKVIIECSNNIIKSIVMQH